MRLIIASSSCNNEKYEINIAEGDEICQSFLKSFVYSDGFI